MDKLEEKNHFPIKVEEMHGKILIFLETFVTKDSVRHLNTYPKCIDNCNMHV